MQHQAAINALNLKIGDTVKLVRKVATQSEGWSNSWDDPMDLYIGLEGQVLSIPDRHGVKIKFEESPHYGGFGRSCGGKAFR